MNLLSSIMSLDHTGWAYVTLVNSIAPMFITASISCIFNLPKDLGPGMIQLAGTVLLLLSAARLSSAARGVDLTLVRGAMGPDVVRAVANKLDDINLFDSPSTSMADRQTIELLMRESAFVQSMDGTQFPLGIEDGGIWRISRDLFDRTRNYSYPELFDEICRTFCMDWMNVRYNDLQMPLYSGLATRIHLFHLFDTGQGIPGTATDMNRAIFWANAFGGDTSVSSWLSRVEDLRRVEGSYT